MAPVSHFPEHVALCKAPTNLCAVRVTGGELLQPGDGPQLGQSICVCNRLSPTEQQGTNTITHQAEPTEDPSLCLTKMSRP